MSSEDLFADFSIWPQRFEDFLATNIVLENDLLVSNRKYPTVSSNLLKFLNYCLSREKFSVKNQFLGPNRTSESVEISKSQQISLDFASKIVFRARLSILELEELLSSNNALLVLANLISSNKESFKWTCDVCLNALFSYYRIIVRSHWKEIGMTESIENCMDTLLALLEETPGPPSELVLWDVFCAQVRFEIGENLFLNEDHINAFNHLSESLRLVRNIEQSQLINRHIDIDLGKLKRYISICSDVLFAQHEISLPNVSRIAKLEKYVRICEKNVEFVTSDACMDIASLILGEDSEDENMVDTTLTSIEDEVSDQFIIFWINWLLQRGQSRNQSENMIPEFELAIIGSFCFGMTKIEEGIG
ncbi:hypothetical protein HK096_004990 [Nowakowskiella sp. JEL0078]|nr:hypothetical protein HK096_004990 [Nowakowskiella sp. JEL0078]